MTKPKELGSVPDSELEMNTSAGDFWVLGYPGTDQHIMAKGRDGNWMIMTFPTEQVALKFKATHAVPAEVVPRYIPLKLH